MKHAKTIIIVLLTGIISFLVYGYTGTDRVKELISAGKYREALTEIEKTTALAPDLNYLAIICWLNLFDNENLPVKEREEYFNNLKKNAAWMIAINDEAMTGKRVREDLALKKAQLINNGILKYNENKLASAFTFLHQANEISVILGFSDTALLFNIARIAYQNNDIKNASHFANQAIESGVNRTEAYYLLVDICKRDPSCNSPAPIYKKARLNKAADNNLIHEEVNHYLALGNNMLTLETLDEIIMQYPDKADYHYIRGMVCEDESKTDEAEKCYIQAINKDPQHFHSHFALGNLYLGQALTNQKVKETFGHYLSKARHSLEKAEKIDPSDKGLLLSLSQLYSLTGDSQKFEAVKKKQSQLR